MLAFVDGKLWHKLQDLGEDPVGERFRRIFSSVRNHARRGATFARVVQQVNRLHFSDATDVIVRNRFSGSDVGRLLWPRYSLVLDPVGRAYYWGGRRIDVERRPMAARFIQALAAEAGDAAAPATMRNRSLIGHSHGNGRGYRAGGCAAC